MSPSSLAPDSGAGVFDQTQRLVLLVRVASAAALAFGAGPSHTILERPRSSAPVTTRRIGVIPDSNILLSRLERLVFFVLMSVKRPRRALRRRGRWRRSEEH